MATGATGATGDIAVARSVDALRRTVASWRGRQQRVGLVPTMGAIHDGHLALVHAARAQSERVVASLFVNPKQFGLSEDFAAYPRSEAADVAAFHKAGVDLVFIPTVAAMYPPGFATSVQVAEVSTMPAVQEARAEWEKMRAKERFFF